MSTCRASVGRTLFHRNAFPLINAFFKKALLALACAYLCGAARDAHAQASIAAWDFFTGGSVSAPTWTAEVFNANMDSSAIMTRGSSAAASAANNSFRTTGFQNNGLATTNTDYFQVTLSASAGYTLSITSITGRFNGTATYYASPGVSDQWAYSLDGSTFTLIGSPLQSTSLTRTWDFSGVSALQNISASTAVTLRYYATGQTGTGGWGYFSTANNSYGLDIVGLVSLAGPEIAVSGNGANIAAGDATPSVSDDTDFGTLGVVGDTVTHTFTITNTGAASLTVGNVSASGTDAADFIVTSQPAGTVAVGNSTTFQVQFNPSGSGVRSATLSFSNNDGDENPFTFAVQGTGAAAGISNNPTSLSFNTVAGNSPADQSFTITNVGMGTLNYTVSDDAAWLTTTPSSGNLVADAGDSITVSINGTGLNVGTSNATITVTDAAASNSPKTVSVTLTIVSGATPPTVTTDPVTTYSYTTATVDGEVTSSGGAIVTERGVAYGTGANPTTNGSKVVSGSGVGTFSADLTSLSPNTLYHVRAYAVNSEGVAYGSDQTFTTLALTLPTVDTDPITAIGVTTAGVSGTVSAGGGATVTQRGFVRNTNGSPTTADTTTTSGSGTGTYSAVLTGLTAGQTYYVRAYAINSVGTAYGTEQSFTANCFTSIVTGVHASPTGATSFTATWTALSGATSYRLDVATNGTFNGSGAGGLFISQYYEGTSNNKWIELYNASGSSIDLGAGGYRIGIWANAAREGWKSGTAPGSSIVLSGTIPAGGVFLLRNSSASLPGYATADQSSGSVTFTGDDTVALYLGATYSTTGLVDSIGLTANSLQDTSIVRKPGALTGNTALTDYSASDWNTYANTSVDSASSGASEYIGSHNVDVVPPSYIAGYSNLTVSGTSQAVSGLNENQAYYFRVRAVGGTGCTSLNSATASVTTISSTPILTFTAASASASEGAGTATATITASITADATVNVAVASATATDPDDYTLASTSIVFTAGGATSQNVTFNLVDDLLAEGSETVTIYMSQFIHATAGATTNFALTITDNEPRVQFSFSSTSVTEDVGTVQVVVYKSNTLNNVSGQIAISGSAVDPTDYTIDTTNFTLNGATTSATITVTIANDAVAEFTDSIQLSLVNIANAGTGSPAFCSVNILNDGDGPTLNRGAIAPIGIHMTDPDDFAIVALETLPAGALINFTDNAWGPSGISNNEGTISWITPGGGVTAGTVILFSNNWSSVGSATGSVALSTSGDQLLIYQGNSSDPFFLHALNNQGAAVWQSSVSGTSDSLLPDGLTNGVNAVALTEAANGAYSGSTTGDKETLLSQIGNPANWTMSGTRASVTFLTGPFTLTGPTPEIGVLGTNGAVIVSGDVTPSAADGTDFGSLALFGETKDHVFTITNSGSASLTVTGIETNGPHAADFTLIAAPDGSVSAGSMTTFTLRFDPSSSGIRTAEVSIANSDSDENPYTFRVVGTGVAPPAPAVAFSTNVETVSENSGSAMVTVFLSSTADATVNVQVATGTSGAALGSDFSLSATQFVFTAGGATSQTFTITGLQDSAAEYSEFATLSFANLSGVTNGSPASILLTMTDDDAPANLNPGDIAIVGRNLGTDAFSILTLTNITAGQVIYFTDNGWDGTRFRGANTAGAGSEDLIKLRINSAIPAGVIICSSDTGDARWTWTTSGSIPLTNDSFSALALVNSGSEQIYAFQADNGAPLQNPTVHLFVLDDTAGFETATSTTTGAEPPGVSSNNNTAVSYGFTSTDIVSIDMSKATNSMSKAQWLAFVNTEENWLDPATALPCGNGVAVDLACAISANPRIVSPGNKTFTVGSLSSFTVMANDPGCYGVSLTATGLPSGASFSATGSGTNTIGTFSWNPNIGQQGTYPIRFIATDLSAMSSSLIIRVYVRSIGESTNSSGVPLSQTNWYVEITDIPSNGANGTLTWEATPGITYDVYYSDSSLGSGMSWVKAGTIEATASTMTTNLSEDAKRFFKVVPSGETPTSSGAWGVIKPTIKGANLTMLSAPLQTDLDFNGDLGAALAEVLQSGDKVFILQPGTENFTELTLNSSAQWIHTLGPNVTALNAGQGFQVQKNAAGDTQFRVVGPAGNVGTNSNTLVVGYNIIGLSEGKDLPASTAFESASPIGNFSQEQADQVIIQNTNGSYRRLIRRPDGTWYDTANPNSSANTSLILEPGSSYYYIRRSSNTSVTF